MNNYSADDVQDLTDIRKLDSGIHNQACDLKEIAATEVSFCD